MLDGDELLDLAENDPTHSDPLAGRIMLKIWPALWFPINLHNVLSSPVLIRKHSDCRAEGFTVFIDPVSR